MQQEPPRRKTNNLAMGAPLRLASETLAADDAPSWFGAAKLGDPSNVRRTDPAMASPPSSPPQQPLAEQLAEATRSSSVASSVNFSYPARTRVGSPPVSPTENPDSASSLTPTNQYPQTADNHHKADNMHRPRQQSQRHEQSASSTRSVSSSSPALVYDPNSRRMVRQADLEAVEYAVLEASQRPTASKNNKRTSRGSGSHLSESTMGRTRGTVARASEDERSRTAGATMRLQPAVSTVTPTTPVAVAVPRDSEQQATKRQSLITNEGPQPSDQGSRNPPQRVSSVPSLALDTTPPKPKLYSEADAETRSDAGVMHRTSAPSSAPSATPNEIAQPVDPVGREVSRATDVGSSIPQKMAHERTHSNSPVRQAHFGPVQNTLTVKHSPPPRSISPRKSALKWNSPSRGASPSDDTSESSTIITQHDEQPVSRRKSVRVSFDDANTQVVGESASTNQSDSPLLASPQNATTRRPWLGIGRAKKELPSLDDDELMKPRPALPSFGSIRERKPRELASDEDERPLVRPIADLGHSPSLPASPTIQPSVPTATEDSSSGVAPLGLSSDHAVGAILSQEQEHARHAANISKFREPLPPVVTSVEGSGYLSDSSSTSAEELATALEVPGESDPQFVAATDPKLASSKPPHTNGTAVTNNTAHIEATQASDESGEPSIPTISISQPTPSIVEGERRSSYIYDVPGGFPDDESEPSITDAYRNAAPPQEKAETSAITKTPDEERSEHTSPEAQPRASLTVDPESDTESSIYSDAYEDLSDVEGDGFLSLDAVVESPLRPNTSKIIFNQEAPREVTVEPTPQDVAVPEAAASVPTLVAEDQKQKPLEDDWEKAKAYWRSLSADKRAQLEKEAQEDAGVEADFEEARRPVDKPRKKKSIERRNSERKALAVIMAQQMMAQQQKEKPANPERTYMIEPGTRWSEPESDIPIVRTTLRGESESETPMMRRTLRREPQPQPRSANTSHGTGMRKSMRSDSSIKSTGPPAPMPRPLDQRSSRPTSLSSPLPTPISTGGQRQVVSKSPSEPGSGKSSIIPSPLKRRDSTGSESSFKRSRPVSSGQGFSLRKSMRQSSPPPVQTGSHSAKRFSLRSTSPGSPTTSAVSSPQMRQTLRDSSNERRSPTGMRMPSFSLSSGGKKSGGKRASKSKSSGSRFSSRFADSSDEDGGDNGGFRSRFEESSDEDEPITPMVLSSPKLSPGHLRNQDSIASTALPEELEESEEANGHGNQKLPGQNKASLSPSQPRRSAEATLRPVRSGHLELPASNTAPALATTDSFIGDRRQSTASPRNSFMSVLRRKKRDSSSKITRGEITESAARRDTKLERNLTQLRGIRTADEDVVEPSRSPKLQKKVVGLALSISGGGPDDLSPLSINTAHSPAARTPLGEEHEAIGAPLKRPQTSGNLGTRTMSGNSPVPDLPQRRPNFLRHSVSAGVVSLDNAGTKKKRFGALRKMFGLHD